MTRGNCECVYMLSVYRCRIELQFTGLPGPWVHTTPRATHQRFLRLPVMSQLTCVHTDFEAQS